MPAEPRSASRKEAPTRPSLLIVDDDNLIIDSLSLILGRQFTIASCNTRPECVGLLRSGCRPDLALLDLGLPPTPHRPDEGFALIGDVLAHSPATRIVVLSGQNAESNARHARTLGAFEFAAKPCDPGTLAALLHRALDFGKEATPAPAADNLLIGESEAMSKLRVQISQFADSPFPVLIEGESGSGKEIVASHYLHASTVRRDKPYLALNCAAISPTLLEPTLFGHVKGAFTGATANKPGYFEEAADGTLFLDEIGELPLELQPKLLRVLENGEFHRVGDTQPRHSSARVVAATNRDLRKEVREGRFRGDLYHRLSVFTISVPPLRDMGHDKHLLLAHYRAQVAQRTAVQPFRLSDEALAQWEAYDFPGNVRELRNVVIRLCAKYAGQTVSAEQLADEFDTDEPAPESAPTLPQSAEDAIAVARRHLQGRDSIRLDHILDMWEHAYIEAALRLTHGNVSQAARMLGINRTTLYNRMEARHRSQDVAD